jgi:hypothetical protein
VKPWRVLPNELGPLEVMVSRPTLRMRILASSGISSSSSLESWLNTFASFDLAAGFTLPRLSFRPAAADVAAAGDGLFTLAAAEADEFSPNLFLITVGGGGVFVGRAAAGGRGIPPCGSGGGMPAAWWRNGGGGGTRPISPAGGGGGATPRGGGGTEPKGGGGIPTPLKRAEGGGGGTLPLLLPPLK